MKQQGINMVRTGLWTAWSRAMLDPGALDENVLSALDAYVLCAAKHGILVTFNFYAFLPPSFGDANPYLGPRALEGQRAFLTALGEPLPRRLVGPLGPDQRAVLRAARGPLEQPADPRRERAQGLGALGRARSTGTTSLLLRDLWRDTGDDLFDLPRPDELRYSFLREQPPAAQGARLRRVLAVGRGAAGRAGCARS